MHGDGSVGTALAAIFGNCLATCIAAEAAPTKALGTFRRHQTPPSGGRTESLRKGLSGRDAARATMGHGWPFGACLWSNDGVRGVERSETRMAGARPFGSFWGDCQKEPAQQGGTTAPANPKNQQRHIPPRIPLQRTNAGASGAAFGIPKTQTPGTTGR